LNWSDAEAAAKGAKQKASRYGMSMNMIVVKYAEMCDTVDTLRLSSFSTIWYQSTRQQKDV